MAMLEHRGPDANGMHVEPAIALAHTRLSVIDLSGGAQPMTNEDGSLWIAFNGEIFNYVELRDELTRRGHHFASLSDTEVILHLFEEFGADAVSKLNGQWAFAIWDRNERTLFLSRDRVGVRPLFYTQAGGEFIFASEIKALFAHPAVQRQIDPVGLDNVLTFWTTLAPRTLFRNINELPPGHSLTWRDGNVSLIRHWDPAFEPAPDADENERRDRLLEALTHATTIRLRSDVPVGAYLSGGLDSSSVACAARLLKEDSRRFPTFSVVFNSLKIRLFFEPAKIICRTLTGDSQFTWKLAIIWSP